MLEVKNIVKSYGRERVLDGASLKLKQGEVLLLDGENGTGKSTLLLAAAGLLKPDSGTVLYDGRDIYKDRTKNDIAYVPQEPALISAMTVKANLKFWAEAAGVSKAQERMDSLISSLGLESVENKKVAKLSGGMKKRTNLAVSLLKPSRLLLLDEPFANVDTSTVEAIYSLLLPMREQGCAMILVSHIDEMARTFSNHMLTLREGRCV